MTTGLLIGDAHAYPGTSNERFGWAGRAARELGVDFVWNAGDWFDMPSLFGLDKTRNPRNVIIDGHRYDKDLEAGWDALDKFHTGLGKASPKLYYTLGNHEERIGRYMETEAAMAGHVSYEDLTARDRGWKISEYLEPLKIAGAVFCHAYKADGAKNPIGGVTSPQRIFKDFGIRTLFRGHDHKFSVLERGDKIDGGVASCVSVGCYFDIHGQAHKWAGYDVHNWRAGLLWVDLYKGKLRDFEWISLGSCRTRFGG